MSSKTYVCHIEVRGYELDSFGHVNHSVYINYMEHARWKLLEEEGITLQLFNDWKRWPVIAELEARYFKPTFLADRLEIQSRVVDRGKANFTVEQSIVRGGEVVFKGKVRVVTINEKGRPAELPEKFQDLWKA